MFSDTNVLIDYQGNVTWYTEGLLHTSCSLDVTRLVDKPLCLWLQNVYGHWTHDHKLSRSMIASGFVCFLRYPFDKQHCPLTFGPWSYDVSKLELRPVTMWEMVGPQFHNTEWAMIDVPVETRTVGFTSTKYAALTYTIILQRKPGFVLFNLVSWWTWSSETGWDVQLSYPESYSWIDVCGPATFRIYYTIRKCFIIVIWRQFKAQVQEHKIA